MKLTRPVTRADKIRGKINAPVTLLEYGDFECPDCGRAYPIVKEVLETVGDRVKFVFRYFPLSSSHPNAVSAACAAEAASRQGKFWEMHDLLFENQNALKDEDLLSYAQYLDLNIRKFRKDFSLKETERKVKADFMSGVKSGVSGTPTFFINGERFDEPYDFDLLVESIESAMKQKGRG